MISLIVALVILCGIFLYLTTVKPKHFPPGPQWFPIKGSVDALRKYIEETGNPSKAYWKLAKDYNTNVLGLKLGASLAVFVFTYDTIKHVLKSEDFDSRPDDFFIRLRSMGLKKGITCADGERWSSQRSFLVKHFRNLGFGKNKMQQMIRSELDDILLDLRASGLDVDVGKLLSPAVISVLWSLTAGVRIKKGDVRLERILVLLGKRSKIFDTAGGTLNMYPWLRFVIPERSGYTLMKEINEEMRAFFAEVIAEHYANWHEGRTDDLIYAFITEMKKELSDSFFTEDQLIMVCVDILIAGSQTTSNTLAFVFLMMILHEDVQEKVHQELDRVFQKHIPIEYDARISAPYTEAVLMEVERYLHVIPLSGPRRVLKNTTLEGHVIPKDATILISLYSVHMDRDFWGDPEVFRPERFLDDAGQLAVPERLIPFGLGRRRCPGESLAKSCLFIFFAEIMRNFTVKCPENKKKPTGIPISGISLFPEPYTAAFIRRS